MTDASAAMHANDRVAHQMGMTITHAGPGLAVVAMTVTDAMVNGLGICHGGVVFTLADTAMAHASNAGNERAVATSASIEWMQAARSGDHLVASCRSIGDRGRNTVHDVEVVNQDGDTVAIMRGQTLTVGGAVTEARD